MQPFRISPSGFGRRHAALAAACAAAFAMGAAPILAQAEEALSADNPAEQRFVAEFEPYAALPDTAEPAAKPGAVDVTAIEPALPEEVITGGMASWYGPKFKGRRTASGERFNPSDYTAAHRSLPFGSKVRVTNRRNGRTVVVRINDRGPFVRGRVIDVSQAAAGELGLIGPGHGEVALALLP